MTPGRAADARLGLLCDYAFDMFAGASGTLTPAADPRLSPDWILRGHITAQDVLWHPFSWLELGEHVCYGFLAESAQRPGEFVIAVRGTANPAEWMIDGKFALVPHPAGGHAEAGFYGVFQTMRYQPLGAPDGPVGAGIAAAVGQGAVTVIGHSLGAALATYLALDLAKDQGARVSARIFASPRPGDQGFADAFAAHVSDAVAYARARDKVPEVPEGFGYLPLHCLQIIGADTAQSIIKDSLTCEHHIVSYASALDYAAADWSAFPVCDESLTACILGPAP